MINRKNHNSIIFLTTLSVYLGLVLVGGGATPSVFAQAAMTQKFDVQSEIEVKDDLDKKPDENDSIDFVRALDDYFKDSSDFVADLQKLHGIEKFDLDYDTFTLDELGFTPCNVNGDPVHHAKISQRVDNNWLEPAITDASYKFRNWDFLSDCLKDSEFETGLSTSSRFKFSYDKKTLQIEVSAFKSSPQRAEYLAEKFNQAFKLYEVDEDEINAEKIYQNTSFNTQNNQVFIVTRLPRAAIDELLADKKAQ